MVGFCRARSFAGCPEYRILGELFEHFKHGGRACISDRFHPTEARKRAENIHCGGGHSDSFLYTGFLAGKRRDQPRRFNKLDHRAGQARQAEKG